MEKLKRTAKGLDTFFKLAYRLGLAAIILGGIIILFVWWLYLGDPDILDLLRFDLTFGGIRFRLADSVVPGREYGFWYFLLGTLIGGAQLPVFCMIFHSIRGILEPMKEGKPFDENIAGYLRRLGWLTIANGILAELAELVTIGNFLTGYDLGALFLSDKITQVTTSHSFDATFLIYAVVLFLLSEIFRHGAQLQQLSDETL